MQQHHHRPDLNIKKLTVCAFFGIKISEYSNICQQHTMTALRKLIWFKLAVLLWSDIGALNVPGLHKMEEHRAKKSFVHCQWTKDNRRRVTGHGWLSTSTSYWTKKEFGSSTLKAFRARMNPGCRMMVAGQEWKSSGRHVTLAVQKWRSSGCCKNLIGQVW